MVLTSTIHIERKGGRREISLLPSPSLYLYIYIYLEIDIYIEREREGEREREREGEFIAPFIAGQ